MSIKHETWINTSPLVHECYVWTNNEHQTPLNTCLSCTRCCAAVRSSWHGVAWRGLGWHGMAGGGTRVGAGAGGAWKVGGGKESGVIEGNTPAGNEPNPKQVVARWSLFVSQIGNGVVLAVWPGGLLILYDTWESGLKNELKKTS